METTTDSAELASQSLADSADSDRCRDGPLAPPSLDAVQLRALAGQLKALADPTRLGMLDLLVQQGRPLCVCDITAQFAQRQPTISHHLGSLRRARLIGGEKRGIWSYYWATAEGCRAISLLRTLL